METYIKPRLLKPGDTVAIVAPAGVVEREYIEKAVHLFGQWGLKVALGSNLFARNGIFAGTDKQRLSDLQQALDAEEVKAVICARGGYGMLRILDSIHWHKFLHNPKWVAGFSDITALHAAILNRGIQSLHSLMPINMANPASTSTDIENLHRALFHGTLEYKLQPFSQNCTGVEKACLAGGNLSLLYALACTSEDIDWKGKIMFIEEVGEYTYHLDRMMQSFRLSGRFEGLAGIIVGGLSEMNDEKRPFGRTPEEIIADAVKGYSFPVAFGFPAGHIATNHPLILGAEVALEVRADGVSIKM